MEHERYGMSRAVGGVGDAAFLGGDDEGWRGHSLDVVVSSADVFVAHGLRWTVEHQRWSDFSEVSVTEATTLGEAVTATTTLRPKVIVLDTGRTPAQCFAYLPVLTEHSGVVLISRRHDANFAQLARRRGVAEVLVYDESADLRVVRAVRTVLSRRGNDVMSLVADGRTNGEVAVALGLTEKTVKNHINRIFAKLNVRTRVQAVLAWNPVGDDD